MRRRRLLTASTCGVLLAAYALVGRQRARGDWSVVERGSLSLTVEVEGTLRAVRSRPFGPPPVPSTWQFKITYMAPEGTTVTAGTPLVGFDDSDLRRNLLEVQAQHESAIKELEKKTADVAVRRRDDDLRATEAQAAREKADLKLQGPVNVVSANERAKLRLDLELAEKQLKHLAERRSALDVADQAELTALRENRDRAATRVQDLEAAIARMTVVAPHDGTVIYAAQRSGEKKRVGDAVWHHESVLEFPDMSELTADGMVNEVDVGRVAPGQPVELRLDAHPHVRYKGTVRAVGQSVQPRSRSSPLRVIPVLIELTETDSARMRPEMRFHGRIEVERIEDVLTVPRVGVQEVQGRPVVLRQALTGIESVPVVLGRRNRDRVEVREGINEGDRLLLPADSHLGSAK